MAVAPFWLIESQAVARDMIGKGRGVGRLVQHGGRQNHRLTSALRSSSASFSRFMRSCSANRSSDIGFDFSSHWHIDFNHMLVLPLEFVNGIKAFEALVTSDTFSLVTRLKFMDECSIAGYGNYRRERGCVGLETSCRSG